MPGQNQTSLKQQRRVELKWLISWWWECMTRTCGIMQPPQRVGGGKKKKNQTKPNKPKKKLKLSRKVLVEIEGRREVAARGNGKHRNRKAVAVRSCVPHACTGLLAVMEANAQWERGAVLSLYLMCAHTCGSALRYLTRSLGRQKTLNANTCTQRHSNARTGMQQQTATTNSNNKSNSSFSDQPRSQRALLSLRCRVLQSLVPHVLCKAVVAGW